MQNENEIVSTREYPPYALMVKRLFKVLPEMPHASAMHAAIGLSGEAAEWLLGDSRKNVIEEAGDMEFYIEAMKQHVVMDYSAAVALGKADHRATNIGVHNAFINIVTITGDILDTTKKSWIYGKEMNNVEISRLILILELNLELVYELFGTNRAEVWHMNQVKLIGPGGRFESGFYSDSAAIERKDKVPGEDRNFIGKPAEAVDWTLQTR